MKEEKLEKLLTELADATTEPVSPGLAEAIKHQIPQPLMPSKSSTGTINIIIDLRINRLAAAAIIIVTTALFLNFLGSRDSPNDGLYKESKLLIKYCLGVGDSGRSNLLNDFEQHLINRGTEVVCYGDSIPPDDSHALLMHWKLADGKYKVIFGNYREETVTAEELIELQAQMLQKK